MKTFLPVLFALFFSAAIAQNGTKVNDTIYRNLSVTQADSLIQANTGNPDFIIIDLRTAGECTTTGIIANAINIDFYNPDRDSLIQALDHSKRYLIYCAGGSRSGQVFAWMQLWNFKEVYNMLGGINGWIGAGKPVVPYTVGIDLAFLDDIVPLIYPNPVHSSCTLSLPPGYTGNISLMDAAGRIIFSRSSVSGDQFIDMSGCSNGLYFLRLGNAGVTFTGRVLKQ